MNRGRTVFAQPIEYISQNEFYRCVARDDGDHRIRKLSCGAISCNGICSPHLPRESPRHRGQLGGAWPKALPRRLPIPGEKSTLADANEVRDWILGAAQICVDRCSRKRTT